MSDEITFLQRRIRDIAFFTVTLDLRRHGIVPSLSILQTLALRAVNGAARSENAYLTPLEHKTLSGDLAASIALHWDPKKARPAPAVSRTARALEEQQILQALYGTADLTPSIRTVAEQLGVSKARIQRIIEKFRSDVHNTRSISPGANRVLSIIRANTPPDGNRAVDLRRLQDAAHFGKLETDVFFSEINKAKTSTTLLHTTTRSCLGSHWVIVCRGRRKPEPILRSWLERVEHARLSPGRNPLRPDQRHFVLDLKLAAPNPVFRDLQAVLSVARGTRSLPPWRDYVEASVQNKYDEGEIDREAIVTVCQSMLRLSNVDLFMGLSKAANWPVHAFTRTVCQSLFTMTQVLIAKANYHADKDLVKMWSDETSYRERIVFNRLPGRKVQDFDAVMAAPDDESWLVWNFDDERSVVFADDPFSEFPAFLRDTGNQDRHTIAAREPVIEDDEGYALFSHLAADGFLLPVDES